jgi:hypothetical protein
VTEDICIQGGISNYDSRWKGLNSVYQVRIEFLSKLLYVVTSYRSQHSTGTGILILEDSVILMID